MTIYGVGTYSHPSPVLDVSGQLALLVLEQQEQQQEAHLQDLATAREQFVAESNQQVAAMHEQASVIRLGAVFQATASVAAADIQVIQALDGPAPGCVADRLYNCGSGLAGGLGEPLGKWLGDAPAADAAADAKQHGTRAQLAESRMSEAKDAIKRSDERQDQALQWLSNEVSSDGQATAAIVAGLA
jgi:hypothetical protein